jgi:hypothetical protein
VRSALRGRAGIGNAGRSYGHANRVAGARAINRILAAPRSPVTVRSSERPRSGARTMTVRALMQGG